MHRDDKLIGETYEQLFREEFGGPAQTPEEAGEKADAARAERKPEGPLADFESQEYGSIALHAVNELDETIQRIISAFSLKGAKGFEGSQNLEYRRKIGDIMVEKIYRDLMHINVDSSVGYKHDGHTLGVNDEDDYNTGNAPLDGQMNRFRAPGDRI